jgi:uncharacterized protein (DUF305 family)
MEHSSWLRLAVMTVLSFISMYILMYMMIDRFENFYPNINQVYMAGMMTAAMVIIELLVMGPMYKSGAVKYLAIGVAAVALVLFIAFTRYQTGITENDFLRSMIPHHAGAILMCEQNENLTDPEVLRLCGNIITSQESEIEQMKAILGRK